MCTTGAACAGSFIQTGASHSVTATAGNVFNESDSSDAFGIASLLVREEISNQYLTDARVVAFSFTNIEMGAPTACQTQGDTPVGCSAQADSSVSFELPVDSAATLVSTGPGGIGWQASAREGGTASYTVTLTDANGLVFTRSATSDPEVFEAVINLPAGEYTLSLSSSTSSRADGDPSITSIGNAVGGVLMEFAEGFVGCNAADSAEPFGVLDLGDIGAFVSGFTGADPIADLDNNGIYDLTDIGLFVTAFTGGCP